MVNKGPLKPTVLPMVKIPLKPLFENWTEEDWKQFREDSLQNLQRLMEHINRHLPGALESYRDELTTEIESPTTLERWIDHAKSIGAEHLFISVDAYDRMVGGGFYTPDEVTFVMPNDEEGPDRIYHLLCISGHVIHYVDLTGEGRTIDDIC